MLPGTQAVSDSTCDIRQMADRNTQSHTCQHLLQQSRGITAYCEFECVSIASAEDHAGIKWSDMCP